MNFFKAYATLAVSAVSCEVRPVAVKEFASIWHENKASGHFQCNYNYLAGN